MGAIGWVFLTGITFFVLGFIVGAAATVTGVLFADEEDD